MSTRFGAPTRRTPYEETFNDGPGGWCAWAPRQALPPEIRDGMLVTHSPWWVDANHAPPGAGYLHLLAALFTRADFVHEYRTSPNRFVEGGYSRDFRNGRMTVRLRGNVELRGAEMMLLVQADVPGTRTNFVLTGQPFKVTTNWSEQTIILIPDPTQWVCLGARHDETDFYGYGNIADVLQDVNMDIIFVLFPLQIVPVGPVTDIHKLRPHRDYEVDWHYLPQGEFEIDTVRIEYDEG